MDLTDWRCPNVENIFVLSKKEKEKGYKFTILINCQYGFKGSLVDTDEYCCINDCMFNNMFVDKINDIMEWIYLC